MSAFEASQNPGLFLGAHTDGGTTEMTSAEFAEIHYGH